MKRANAWGICRWLLLVLAFTAGRVPITAAEPVPSEPTASPSLLLGEPAVPVSPIIENGTVSDPDRNPLENFALFAALAGAKSPQDVGVNATTGGRTSFNWAYPLLESANVGIQAGSALNYQRNAVTVLKTVDHTGDRYEIYTTLGVFQRTDAGFSWAVAYDILYEQYYTHIFLGQWRGQVGYFVGDNDELGVWGTLGDHGAAAQLAGIDLVLHPMSQACLFWRHYWNADAWTRIWGGMGDRHGRFVLVAPGETPIQHPFEFGADIYVKLNDYVGLFGEANFLTPNDTGTVDASLGFVVRFGETCRTTRQRRFAALLPVANNNSFTPDLDRR